MTQGRYADKSCQATCYTLKVNLKLSISTKKIKHKQLTLMKMEEVFPWINCAMSVELKACVI